MKKVLIGIFAHPDDEAFLISGSFLKWVSEGADLHLICITKGEKGQNPDKVPDLGATRLKEWHQAGILLGASSQQQLGYPDGELSNHLFHQIADDIQQAITDIAKTYQESCELELITYENCGITGHLDHIAVSFITTYIYARLKAELSSLRLLYACACEATSPQDDVSFVFMPKGHEHCDIDLTMDVREFIEQKKQVMHAHYSQRKDAETIISRLGTNLGYEHFNYFKD